VKPLTVQMYTLAAEITVVLPHSTTLLHSSTLSPKGYSYDTLPWVQNPYHKGVLSYKGGNRKTYVYGSTWAASFSDAPIPIPVSVSAVNLAVTVLVQYSSLRPNMFQAV